MRIEKTCFTILKRITSLILAFGVIILLQDCVEDKVTDPNWRPKYVKGTVIDSITNQPLDSTQILKADKRDTTRIFSKMFTDHNGNYIMFLGGDDGTGLVIIADKPNYQRKQNKFSTLTVDTAIINFQLVPIN